jgi:hypothetical protein
VDYLVEFGRRDDVREIVNRYMGLRSVHAVDVGLDERWLVAYLAGYSFRDDYADDVIRRLEHWDVVPPSYPLAGRLAEFFDDEFVAFPFGLDPHWLPPMKGELCRRWGEFGPFVITVVLRPDCSSEEAGAVSEIYPDNRFAVVYDVQPVPRLLASPREAVRPLVGGIGISGASRRPGTLGGIIEVGGGRYGVTCAHVLGAGDEVEQPAPADNPRDATRVGFCRHRSSLTAHSPPAAAYGTGLNRLDAALVEFDDGIDAELEVSDAGPPARISAVSDVHQLMTVETFGARSGHRTLRVGNLRLVGEFTFGSEWYAYEELFQLRRLSRFYGMTGTLSPPVRGGDSGAWVLRPGADGPEWAGMVIAGEGPQGYAVMAKTVEQWIEEETGAGAVTVV